LQLLRYEFPSTWANKLTNLCTQSIEGRLSESNEQVSEIATYIKFSISIRYVKWKILWNRRSCDWTI